MAVNPNQPLTLGKVDIAQIAAAATAVVGVLTSLAVTGILAQLQRNHGVWLLAASPAYSRALCSGSAPPCH